eukprot:TRINITY_DN34373_c1_g1_i1.p1 TRINITY_DN34373_c1_g1~~TRINITY_DN34373_c1_g1_i1.p1  ORF type:complete len:160 (+),score=16.71 TRINITY_DN34373_c1_g1_i1:51-482(+)
MGSKSVINFLKQCIKRCSETSGHDRALGACRVVSGTPGACTMSLKVEEEHCNGMGTLHGGFSAHLVDSITTFALMTNDDAHPGVSVNMNLDYIKAAKLGEEIVIKASTVKKGKTLAFLSCEIQNAEGQILVKGAHTKFIGFGN